MVVLFFNPKKISVEYGAFEERNDREEEKPERKEKRRKRGIDVEKWEWWMLTEAAYTNIYVGFLQERQP